MDPQPTQPSTPIQSVQPSITPISSNTPPTENKPSWMLWVLGVLVVAIISSGGTYLLLGSKATQQQVATPTIAVSHTPIPDPTANWKTYTNTKLGFSFKYPEIASIKTEQKYSFMTGKTVDTLVVEPPYIEPITNYFIFWVSVEPNETSLDSKGLVDNYINNQRKENTAPGNYVAKHVESTKKDYQNNQIVGTFARYGFDRDFVMVVQTKDNRIYTFQIMGDQGDATDYDLEILDQILSTFKFL